MANGYYQMARGWMHHPCFKSEKVFSHREAWIWMIEQATWSPEGRNVNILEKPYRLSRGQLSHSIRFMRDAWGWKKGAVETFLKKLKTWDMIRTDKRTGQLIITICNYDIYQSPTDGKTDSQPDKSRTDVGQTSDKKEEREERKERKERENIYSRKKPKNSFRRPEDVQAIIWEDFIQLREARKAPITETVVERIRAEAGKINWSLEQAITEMIARGWQGFKADWVLRDQDGGKLSQNTKNLKDLYENGW